jgi:hypothetical protein
MELTFSVELMKGILYFSLGGHERRNFYHYIQFCNYLFFNINPCVYKPYTEIISYISLIDENNDFIGSEIADPGRGPPTIQESSQKES